MAVEMVKRASSYIELNKEICRLFGIDTKDVISVNIELRAGNVPTVNVTKYIKTDTGFGTFEQKFTIQAIDDANPA